MRRPGSGLNADEINSSSSSIRWSRCPDSIASHSHKNEQLIGTKIEPRMSSHSGLPVVNRKEYFSDIPQIAVGFSLILLLFRSLHKSEPGHLELDLSDFELRHACFPPACASI